MFTNDEIKCFTKTTLFGFAAGIVIDILVFVYDFFSQTWNCFCEECGGGCQVPEVKSSSLYFYVIFICTLIGLIIGLFIAISDRKDRINKENKRLKDKMSKEAQEKRKEQANSIKVTAMETEKQCIENEKQLEITPFKQHKTIDTIDEISREIATTKKLQSEIGAFVAEIKSKEEN